MSNNMFLKNSLYMRVLAEWPIEEKREGDRSNWREL